jgi:glycosyltransferase 2 family protein
VNGPSGDQGSSLPPVGPKAYRRKLFSRLGISAILAGVFVWFMRRAGLPVRPPARAFEQTQWAGVAAYFGLYGLMHYFRAVRWEYLLRPTAAIPRRRLISIGFIGFLAILLLPLRMGEVVRPYLLKREGHVSASAAMGTIAAERVLDGLYVALLLALALVLVPRRPDLQGVRIGPIDVAHIPQLGYLMVALFTAALAALGLFLWKRALAERLTLAVVGAVSPRLASRLGRVVGGVADGLRSLPDPKLMVPFTFYSALYWCINALGMWVLGLACGLPMTAGQGFAVMGVLSMGILLPAGPGLFGSFQLFVYAALMMFFPDEVVFHEGAAYVFLMYVVQLALHLVAGIVPLVIEKIAVSDALSGGAGQRAIIARRRGRLRLMCQRKR